MNENEVKEYIEGLFENLMHGDGGEFIREEVEDCVIGNIVFAYRYGEITRDDLLKCAEYLKVELDMDVIDKEKLRYEKRKVKRNRK